MFQILFGQTFIMFLLILGGAAIYRAHLSDHDGNKVLSNILLLVITPAMLLDALISIEYSDVIFRSFLISIVLGFAAHFAMILVARLSLGRRSTNPDAGIERFLAAYGNCGFFGVPLVSSVFGPEAVVYMTGFMVSFNVLCWTHGLVEITGETSGKQVLRGMMSPTVISIVIGLLLFLLRIPVETHVHRALTYLGSMNTPLGMIVAGTTLAETGLGGVLKRPRIFLVAAMKLIAAPAVTCVILILFQRFVPLSDELFYTVLIASACPSATTATMMAIRYNKNYEYTAQSFVVSTLMSIFTIPAVVSVVRFIAG